MAGTLRSRQMGVRSSTPRGRLPDPSDNSIGAQLVSSKGAPVRGAEGGTSPFVSPDGTGSAFKEAPVPLRGVDSRRAAGPAYEVDEWHSRRSWGTDDQIVFGTRSEGLYRVSGGGGEPEPLTMLDSERGEASHRFPLWFRITMPCCSWRLLDKSWRPAQLAVLNLDTHEVTHLGLAGVSARYMSTGHLVYASEDGVVRAVPFDMAALEVTGNPIPLIEGVMVKTSGPQTSRSPPLGRLSMSPALAWRGRERWYGWIETDARRRSTCPLARLARPRVSPGRRTCRRQHPFAERYRCVGVRPGSRGPNATDPGGSQY